MPWYRANATFKDFDLSGYLLMPVRSRSIYLVMNKTHLSIFGDFSTFVAFGFDLDDVHKVNLLHNFVCRSAYPFAHMLSYTNTQVAPHFLERFLEGDPPVLDKRLNAKDIANVKERIVLLPC